MVSRISRALQDRWWRWQGRLHHKLTPAYARVLPASPEVRVAKEVHGKGGAGYAICPDGISDRSIVYSFGVGSEVSFDLSLIESYGLVVHAFDPTDQAATFVAEHDFPPEFRFHKIGLSDQDGETVINPLGSTASKWYLPGTLLEVDSGGDAGPTVEVLTLESTMKRLGHDHIDVLKLDIEGAEYRFLEAGREEPIPASQIVLELHPHIANLEDHGTMLGRSGWRRTRAAIDALRDDGYDLFHVSDRGTEFSFRRA